MSQLAHYFVTDIETDGPVPVRNSMLSFATVVVREDGEMCGEFEAVLEPRGDRAQDKETMDWWKTQPEAWQAATDNPQPPKTVMKNFVDWVLSYPEKRSFAARPILFDGIWIDAYLREFADSCILDIDHWGKNIFTAGALDIGTYISGVFGRTDPHTISVKFPPDWLGNHSHTHRAIDDARGYASLLAKLLDVARSQPDEPLDFVKSALHKDRMNTDD